MTTVTRFLVVFAIIFFVVYVIFAFSNNDLNYSSWSDRAQDSCLLVGLIIGGIGGLIGAFSRN